MPAPPKPKHNSLSGPVNARPHFVALVAEINAWPRPKIYDLKQKISSVLRRARDTGQARNLMLVQCEDGNALHHLVRRYDAPELVRLFAAHGAAVDAINERKGHTPLMTSCWTGRSESALALLELGADRTLVSHEAQTAADIARSHGIFEMVALIDGWEARLRSERWQAERVAAGVDHLMPERPRDHLCCITHEPMLDPVCAEDGFTYERTAIERWLEDNDTSPMSREEVSEDMELYPNIALKNMIRDWEEREHTRCMAQDRKQQSTSSLEAERADIDAELRRRADLELAKAAAPQTATKSMKVAELKEALEARGLPTDGKKETLIARLEAAASGSKGKRKAVEAPAPEAKKPRRRFKLVKGIHNLVAGRDYPVGH